MHTSDQTIIISGGSRGLGLHLVRTFLAQSNRVATFARSRTEAMDELAQRYPDQFMFESLDAGDADAVNEFVAKVYARFGAIGGLVNNAAIGQDQLLVHTDLKTIEQLIRVNVLGPTLLTRAVMKRMMLAGRGNICFISSICGSRGYAGLSVYAGSKGYLDAMMRALAREAGNAGILINSVAPGFFESEMSAVLQPSQLETIKRRTPTGVLSDSEDIYTVVDLLISGQVNIQGQVLFVDGGITI